MSDRAVLLGCEIDRLDMEGTLERCQETIDEGGFAQHVAINAAKLVTLQNDPEMTEIVRRCELIGADGQSVVWASKLVGDPLPGRVAGIDLMHRLLAMAQDEGYGVYILGARAEVLGTAVERLREQYPRLRIVGYRDGYFDESEDAAVAEQIRASGAQILFVAISSPRKEYWLGNYGRHSGVNVAMGVGGSIDVVAGVTRRAPAAWQRLGVEWLYRMLQEPRRLFRRYAVTNSRFMLLVVRELARRRLRPRRSAARARG